MIFYFLSEVNMLQGMLIDSTICAEKFAEWDNIKATFTQTLDNQYEVLLEINSNKFLVLMERSFEKIESFEILAAKGFLELSVKVIDLIKRLVDHLWVRAD